MTAALTVDGSIGEPIELGPPGVYRMVFARRAVSAGDDPEGWPCEYRLRFWPVDAHRSRPDGRAEPACWSMSGPLASGTPSKAVTRRAITDIVMLALWAAQSATPVTLAWLADRLLTTTATILGIIERPRASRALSVDGDLDAPLTVPVLAKKPAETRTVPVPPRPPVNRRPAYIASALYQALPNHLAGLSHIPAAP